MLQTYFYSTSEYVVSIIIADVVCIESDLRILMKLQMSLSSSVSLSVVIYVPHLCFVDTHSGCVSQL